MSIGLNLAYRLYVIALPIWAAVTYAWYTAAISLTPTTLAGGWFAAAAFGIGLAAALYAKRDEAFPIDRSRDRLQEFESDVFAGQPLNLYLAALAVWGVVSLVWGAGIGQNAISASVIGYGWYATALFGGVTLLGLCATNLDLILEAADLSSSSVNQHR